MMNPEIKERWLEKLRSGEFPQGEVYLENKGNFCCLGVLCTIAVEDGITTRGADGRDVAFYGDNNTAYLPPEVTEWAGLDGDDGGLVKTPGGMDESLTVLNDRATPFVEIADMIEKSL